MTAEAVKTDSSDHQVLIEQYRLLFRQAPLTVIATTLLVLLITWSFWDSLPQTYLMAWLGAMLTVNAIRLALYMAYIQQDQAKRLSRLLRASYIGVLILSGVIWSALALMGTVAGSFEQLVVITLILAGVYASAIASNSSVMSGFIGFSLPVILPVSAIFFYREEQHALLIAWSIILYTFFMSFAAFEVNRILRKNIWLAIENARLLKNVSRSRDELNNLNKRLANELEDEKESAMVLVQTRERLQGAVDYLAHISLIDGLTGIANRRGFDAFFQKEWSRARRNGENLALVMLDVDFFKQYNDAYGHQAGDECLKRIATVIDNSVRRSADLAARIGGEEFAILLPGTGLNGASSLASQIRATIGKLQIPHEDSPIARFVTLSAGVAAIRANRRTDPAMLFQAADQALYTAKKEGRNVVRIANEGRDGDGVVH
ncbi:MAG: hypothetical protein BMS9Abin15_0994 [Gammaproteobacteria bacterium]|nr:MAG: hypothetical protein BMS9Abin15_0994 [Gammaproteobacteria bacterium]